jgi:hypothetical protein
VFVAPIVAAGVDQTTTLAPSNHLELWSRLPTKSVLFLSARTEDLLKVWALLSVINFTTIFIFIIHLYLT